MKYYIDRPPLAKTFALPSKNSLLKLKKGDLVKLIFKVSDTEPRERMWVKITKQYNDSEWEGKLDNSPYGEKMQKVLKKGQSVAFHPLDIVQIYKKK